MALTKNEWQEIMWALEDRITKVEEETGEFADELLLNTYSKVVIEKQKAK